MKGEKINYFINFTKLKPRGLVFPLSKGPWQDSNQRSLFSVIYKKCNIFRIVVFVIAFFFIAAFVSTQAPQKSNLTHGMVKTKIQKGITSQAEIVSLIGSPNIITKNRDGDEVWTYSRQSFDSESRGLGGGFLFFAGSKAVSSASSNSFDLIITFDNKSIVKDYSVVSSQF